MPKNVLRMFRLGQNVHRIMQLQKLLELPIAQRFNKGSPGDSKGEVGNKTFRIERLQLP